MNRLSEFTSRKVFGVKVLYLVAGFIAIIAVYAWRMKGAPDPEGDAVVDPTGADDAVVGEYGAPSSDVYPNAPQGTVIVAPSTPKAEDAPYEDNQTWMRKGVAYLISSRGGSNNPGTSQLALQHYLAGGSITYAEGVLRDKVVREFGLPPDLNDAGPTGSKPIPSVPRPPTRPTPVKPKPKPPAKPAPYHPKYPGVLRQGSTGANVVAVQRVVHVTPDGKYGPITAAHVKTFQRSRRLTADGVVGPLTWRAMFG